MSHKRGFEGLFNEARHGTRTFEPQDVTGDRFDLMTSFVGRYFIRVSETVINCETGAVDIIYQLLVKLEGNTSICLSRN